MEHKKKTALFHLDFQHLHTAFFFEAALSAIVIVASIVITDLVTAYLRKHHNIPHWCIYLFNFFLTFVTILILFYTSFFVFGYGEAIMV